MSDLPPVAHGARPRARLAVHWPHASPFHLDFKHRRVDERNRNDKSEKDGSDLRSFF